MTSYPDSTHDTKQATVFSTIGLPWRFPAFLITYDEEHPKSSGGVVHFNFGNGEERSFLELMDVYESGVADVRLDEWLDSHVDREMISELEPLLMDALVVYGRRFLENYRYLIRYLKEECPEIAHTSGTPVYDKEGKEVGRENFQSRHLPRKSK